MPRGCKAASAMAAVLTAEDVEALNTDFNMQVEQFRLAYDCRHCAHVEDSTGKCSLDYPNEPLMEAARKGYALTGDGHLVFCKYFELC